MARGLGPGPGLRCHGGGGHGGRWVYSTELRASAFTPDCLPVLTLHPRVHTIIAAAATAATAANFRRQRGGVTRDGRRPVPRSRR